MKDYAGKVLMLVENYIPWDKRVFNEAKTLTKDGYKVTIIALRNNNQKFVEWLDGVKVYRLPTFELFKKSWNPKSSFFKKLFFSLLSVIGYLFEYLYFTLSSLLLSIYILFKDGFDCVHAHNPPDTLFVIGAFYKILGKKYVFDHHDLSPELYLSRYRKEKSLIYKILLTIEKINLKLANIIIATNISYKEIEIERGGISRNKVYVVRNGPDPNKLMPGEPDYNLRNLNKSILAYAGVMGPQDGVDYLLRSLYHLINNLNRKDFYCIIIGTGDDLDNLKSLSRDLQLDDYVLFTGFIPDKDYHRYMSTADICLSPDPLSPLNDISTWIKVLDYMSFGKPIVSFDLKETRYSAQESAIYVPPNDEVEFARAIAKLMDNPEVRDKMGEFGRKRVENELKWDIVGKNLLYAYKSLNT